MTRSALALAMALLGSGVLGSTKQTGALADSTHRWRTFSELEYPSQALVAGIEGTVVIDVTLNDDGTVDRATTLGGHPALATPALDNTRGWRFANNPQRRAIVTYVFAIQRSCQSSEGFLFRMMHSNLVEVIACVPGGLPEVVPTPDEGPQPISFEDLRYPAFAHSARIQGAAVVRATFDVEGVVHSAEGLAGHPALVDAAAQNARTWRYRTKGPGTTVVVYDFQLDGTCLLVRSLFRVVRANYVTVKSCTPLL